MGNRTFLSVNMLLLGKKIELRRHTSFEVFIDRKFSSFSFLIFLNMSTTNVKVMDEFSEENNKVQPRKSSRSTRSASPSVSTEGIYDSEVDNTRSQSVESAGYETTDSKKRKRKTTSKTNSSNKKQANTKLGSNKQEDNERELRNSSQRISKEAREAKKAQRESIIKEK